MTESMTTESSEELMCEDDGHSQDSLEENIKQEHTSSPSVHNSEYELIENIKQEQSECSEQNSLQDDSSDCTEEENDQIDNSDESVVKQEYVDEPESLEQEEQSSVDTEEGDQRVFGSFSKGKGVKRLKKGKGLHPPRVIDEEENKFIREWLRTARETAEASGLSVDPTRCPQCDKQCNSFTVLKKHVQRLHLTNKQHECVQCNKSYSVKTDLTRHVKMVHGGEDFNCQLCDFTTKYRRCLTSHHDAVHLKLKPYSCTQCGAVFSQKQNLEQHELSVHRGTEEKSYECFLCNKKFSRRSYYDIHYRSVHCGEKPHECQLCQLRSVRVNLSELDVPIVVLETLDQSIGSMGNISFTLLNENQPSYVTKEHSYTLKWKVQETKTKTRQNCSQISSKKDSFRKRSRRKKCAPQNLQEFCNRSSDISSTSVDNIVTDALNTVKQNMYQTLTTETDNGLSQMTEVDSGSMDIVKRFLCHVCMLGFVEPVGLIQHAMCTHGILVNVDATALDQCEHDVYSTNDYAYDEVGAFTQLDQTNKLAKKFKCNPKDVIYELTVKGKRWGQVGGHVRHPSVYVFNELRGFANGAAKSLEEQETLAENSQASIVTRINENTSFSQEMMSVELEMDVESRNKVINTSVGHSNLPSNSSNVKARTRIPTFEELSAYACKRDLYSRRSVPNCTVTRPKSSYRRKRFISQIYGNNSPNAAQSACKSDVYSRVTQFALNYSDAKSKYKGKRFISEMLNTENTPDSAATVSNTQVNMQNMSVIAVRKYKDIRPKPTEEKQAIQNGASRLLIAISKLNSMSSNLALTPETRRYDCHVCNSAFERAYDFNRHAACVHGIITNVGISDVTASGGRYTTLNNFYDELGAANQLQETDNLAKMFKCNPKDFISRLTASKTHWNQRGGLVRHSSTYKFKNPGWFICKRRNDLSKQDNCSATSDRSAAEVLLEARVREDSVVTVKEEDTDSETNQRTKPERSVELDLESEDGERETNTPVVDNNLSSSNVTVQTRISTLEDLTEKNTDRYLRAARLGLNYCGNSQISTSQTKRYFCHVCNVGFPRAYDFNCHGVCVHGIIINAQFRDLENVNGIKMYTTGNRYYDELGAANRLQETNRLAKMFKCNPRDIISKLTVSKTRWSQAGGLVGHPSIYTFKNGKKLKFKAKTVNRERKLENLGNDIQISNIIGAASEVLLEIRQQKDSVKEELVISAENDLVNAADIRDQHLEELNKFNPNISSNTVESIIKDETSLCDSLSNTLVELDKGIDSIVKEESDTAAGDDILTLDNSEAHHNTLEVSESTSNKWPSNSTETSDDTPESKVDQSVTSNDRIPYVLKSRSTPRRPACTSFNRKRFFCHVCDYGFHRPRDLNRHGMHMHGIIIEASTVYLAKDDPMSTYTTRDYEYDELGCADPCERTRELHRTFKHDPRDVMKRLMSAGQRWNQVGGCVRRYTLYKFRKSELVSDDTASQESSEENESSSQDCFVACGDTSENISPHKDKLLSVNEGLDSSASGALIDLSGDANVCSEQTVKQECIIKPLNSSTLNDSVRETEDSLSSSRQIDPVKLVNGVECSKEDSNNAVVGSVSARQDESISSSTTETSDNTHTPQIQQTLRQSNSTVPSTLSLGHKDDSTRASPSYPAVPSTEDITSVLTSGLTTWDVESVLAEILQIKPEVTVCATERKVRHMLCDIRDIVAYVCSFSIMKNSFFHLGTVVRDKTKPNEEDMLSVLVALEPPWRRQQAIPLVQSVYLSIDAKVIEMLTINLIKKVKTVANTVILNKVARGLFNPQSEDCELWQRFARST